MPHLFLQVQEIMRWTTAVCWAGVLLANAIVGVSAQEHVGAPSFVVECGVLLTGEGDRLEHAALVIRDGNIAKILAAGDSRPDDLPRVDARDKFVMPGLVAADSDLAQVEDSSQALTPDFVALDGFDFLRPRRRELGGGITTVYLSPGRSRLIPGQGSVTSLFGDDVVERALADRACLRITLDARSTSAPAVFEPTLAPTADDPLTPGRSQVPSARISQLWALREVFDEARAWTPNDGLIGPSVREDRYDPTALRQVLAQEMPVRISARDAADIRRAIDFAASIRADSFVIEDPWQLAPVARDLQRAGGVCVLRLPVQLSARNRGGENLSDLDDPRRLLENAQIAERAGIPFALVPASDKDLPDLLMLAAYAVGCGVSPQTAMRAVTIDAARALGVDDRVGSLSIGKRADFLILSGEPLGVGTLVEKTYVRGELAFERAAQTDILAVRAETVLTAAGTPINKGVVIAKNGKIRTVGARLAVPFGATEIDLPAGSVLVPGLINAHTFAGMSGRTTGLPTGSAGQDVTRAIRPDDPVLAQVAQSGTTTVLVSGSDSTSRVGARVAAVKAAGEDRESMIVSEIAAVHMRHDAIGKGAITALSGELDKGKKYFDSWQKYEEKLAEWEKTRASAAGEALKAKKAAKAAEAARAAKEAEQEADSDAEAEKVTDPISGIWEFEGSFQQPPVTLQLEADLKLSPDGKVSAESLELTIEFNGRGRSRDISLGSGSKFENGTLTLMLAGGLGPSDVKLEGKVENDTFNGEIESPFGKAEVTGERTEIGEGGAAQPQSFDDDDEEDDGRPKPPTVNEGLEPLRALYAKQAAAIVSSDRDQAIRDVVKLFAERELPLVLTGVSDALETPDLLGDNPPTVLLGPDLVGYEKGELVNKPAVFADRNVNLAFGTGDTLGAKFLLLQAAHAIRYGLDPDAALRALTIDAAKAFHIDDRVGSLERGKDADFVAFSGSPFEPTSRVLLVVVDGRVIFDGRRSTR